MIITHDNGGVVEEYIARERQLHGQRIVIDGACRSACTIYLANPGTCVTPRASLGFHSAYLGADIGGGRFAYGGDLPSYTAAMMGYYPPLVRQWIQQMRPYGLGHDMIVLKGRAMLERVPRCK